MKKIIIHIPTKQKKYPIIIGSGLLNKIVTLINFKNYSSVFIITDTNVGKIYLEKLIVSISKWHPNIKINSHTFPAGDDNKNLQTTNKLYKQLEKALFDRKGLIINLGGGVVSDLGGFVAATYLRGVASINISTSLLGMVDASIGGKVGINSSFHKNLIGNFYHPQAIVIDVDALKTLSKRNLLSGFAEMIKHGLIRDKKYLQLISQKNPLDYIDFEWIKIINASCQIKADIVTKDEREADIRMILNFGHTIGHALESLSLKTDYLFLHGEAIALGMLVEARISNLLNLLSNSELEIVQRIIKKTGLPNIIPASVYSLEAISKEIMFDKKNEFGEVNWSLLTGIGQARANVKVPSNIIKKAISDVTRN